MPCSGILGYENPSRATALYGIFSTTFFGFCETAAQFLISKTKKRLLS
jgi:hypothetical protein